MKINNKLLAAVQSDSKLVIYDVILDDKINDVIPDDKINDVIHDDKINDVRLDDVRLNDNNFTHTINNKTSLIKLIETESYTDEEEGLFLSVSLSIYLYTLIVASFFLSRCLSIYLSIYLRYVGINYLQLNLITGFLYLFIYLFICIIYIIHIYLFIYLFIYLSA
jgi:hypothetical protein